MTAATMSDIGLSTPKKGGGLFPLVNGSCGLHTAPSSRGERRARGEDRYAEEKRHVGLAEAPVVISQHLALRIPVR